MGKRLTKILLAGGPIAALAAPVGAQARQGADDPVGHVRHAAHSTTATKGTSSSSRTRHRHRGRHGPRAGERTQVRGRGPDDGPNHS